MKLLITGGAGYIGSITARFLFEKGYEVVILDSLEMGHEAAIGKDVTFYHGSTHDTDLLARIFTKESIDAVIHFAAYKSVKESVKQPGKYFYNNTAGTISLLNSMANFGIKKLVFSSTAAVYGNPDTLPATENMPLKPENPYGESKALVERLLPWYDKAYGLRSVALRYFNVAGAWPDGSLGEDPSQAECLIPIVLRAITDKSKPLKIFGKDYDTPDGTAVRDYIHVLDLAAGHSSALDYLFSDGPSQIINLGTGKGASIGEVLNQTKSVTGQEVPADYVERRQGDPVSVWADNSKAKDLLKWQPQYELKDILESAWAWQKNYPNGFLKQ